MAFSLGVGKRSIFKARGQNLKITSLNKQPFEVKNGFCELSSSKNGIYVWTVCGEDKKRSFPFECNKALDLSTLNREAQFTIVVKVNKATTQLIGRLDDKMDCLKLVRIMNDINASRNSSSKLLSAKENIVNGFESKENNFPSKSPMTSIMEKNGATIKCDRTPLKGRSDCIPFVDRLDHTLKSNVKSKIFPPQYEVNKKTPSHELSANGKDDVKITAFGASKTSFYGENRISEKRGDTMLKTDIKPSLSSWSFCQRNKSSRVPKESNSSAVVGFSNLGNTCYMNSILQCLLNIPCFFQDLNNIDNLELVCHDSLYNSLCNLGILKYSYETLEHQKFALKRVKSAISTAAKRFCGNAQHDAHEFLCQCLDQLKEDLMNKLKRDNQKLNTKYLDDSSNFSCPVNSNFESTILHTIKCQTCGEKVLKAEDCHDFSLVIPTFDENTNPADHNIKKLLQSYFGDEIIEYSCEKCEGRYSLLSHHFCRLPRVLILHIKRYDIYDVKRSDRISIPKVIDISPHMTSATKPIMKFVYDKERLKAKGDSEFLAVSNVVEKRKSTESICAEPSAKLMKSSPTDTSFPSLSVKGIDKVVEAGNAHMPSAYYEGEKDGDALNSVDSTDSTLQNNDVGDESRDNKLSDTKEDKTNGSFTPSPSKDLEKTKDFLDDIDGTSSNFISDDEEEEFKKALELSMREFEQSQIEALRELRDDTSLPNYSEEKNGDDQNYSDSENVYKLIGIVSHHGENTGTGHYTSDSFDFKSKKWRCYNDSSVKEVKEHEVRFGRSHSAYIVFYMHSQCYETISNS